MESVQPMYRRSLPVYGLSKMPSPMAQEEFGWWIKPPQVRLIQQKTTIADLCTTITATWHSVILGLLSCTKKESVMSESMVSSQPMAEVTFINEHFYMLPMTCSATKTTATILWTVFTLPTVVPTVTTTPSLRAKYWPTWKPQR